MSPVIRLLNSIIILAALASSTSLLASRCAPARKVAGSAAREGFALPTEATTRLSAVRVELLQARCSSRSKYSGLVTGNKYLGLAFPSLRDCLRVENSR